MLSFKPIHENHVMSDTMYLLVIIPPAQFVSVKIPQNRPIRIFPILY